MLRIVLLFSVFLTATLAFTRCDAGEDYSEPTQGVVTTVEEVAPDDYKIASEEPVGTPADSRIIVNNLDGTSQSYTLAEARTIEQTQPDSSRVRRPFRSAMLGYWGFMMLNRMGNRPSAAAYTNNAAYQRSTSSTGSSLNRTSRARSGFGSGKSIRSFGG
ncbi:hypothetical protein LEM8419_02188 [Neolewinella maritima]|uniref:UPF0323 domain-containing protein n=1 Tax=Neolewinella maritima TaxID=1383882 RepID=A0ABM9B1S8_9BACT|nr:hypothetical protein [Neolewinella maritima]CAH1001287.1 hypothetical protein LEM8419_02188 [Neolewinella maritima]